MHQVMPTATFFLCLLKHVPFLPTTGPYAQAVLSVMLSPSALLTSFLAHLSAPGSLFSQENPGLLIRSSASNHLWKVGFYGCFDAVAPTKSP
jgi:hypothetical protein